MCIAEGLYCQHANIAIGEPNGKLIDFFVCCTPADDIVKHLKALVNSLQEFHSLGCEYRPVCCTEKKLEAEIGL